MWMYYSSIFNTLRQSFSHGGSIDINLMFDSLLTQWAYYSSRLCIEYRVNPMYHSYQSNKDIFHIPSVVDFYFLPIIYFPTEYSSSCCRRLMNSKPTLVSWWLEVQPNTKYLVEFFLNSDNVSIINSLIMNLIKLQFTSNKLSR